MRFSVSKKDSLDFLFDIVFKQRVRQRIEGRVRNVEKTNYVVGVDRLVKGTERSTEVKIRVCCVAHCQNKHNKSDDSCRGDFQAIFLLTMRQWMVKFQL